MGKDSALFIFVFAVPNPVHIVGLIKCLLNEKMNHQQTLIGRLLCDLHGLNFSPPVAYNVPSCLQYAFSRSLLLSSNSFAEDFSV